MFGRHVWLQHMAGSDCIHVVSSDCIHVAGSDCAHSGCPTMCSQRLAGAWSPSAATTATTAAALPSHGMPFNCLPVTPEVSHILYRGKGVSHILYRGKGVLQIALCTDDVCCLSSLLPVYCCCCWVVPRSMPRSVVGDKRLVGLHANYFDNTFELTQILS